MGHTDEPYKNDRTDQDVVCVWTLGARGTVIPRGRDTFLGVGRRIDSIVDDMDRKFLRCCFSQSTVCVLYSLQSKAIRTGSVLETTTFSSSVQQF